MVWCRPVSALCVTIGRLKSALCQSNAIRTASKHFCTAIELANSNMEAEAALAVSTAIQRYEDACAVADEETASSKKLSNVYTNICTLELVAIPEMKEIPQSFSEPTCDHRQ